MLDADRLDPPVVSVQDVEQGQERLRPFGIEAEVIDRVVSAPPSQLLLAIRELRDVHHARHVYDLPTGQLPQAGRKLAEALDRIHRGLLLEPANGTWQSED